MALRGAAAAPAPAGPHETIDLTQELPRAAAAREDAIDLTQEGAGDDDEEEEEQFEFLGRFDTVIVGIRYYTGRVGVNEMVKFVREPENPYDPNAVRVENINDEKVGHLKRELVAQIASLLDDGSLVIEGIMPRSSRSAYTYPIACHAWVAIKAHGVAASLSRKLGRAGITLHQMTLAEAAAAAAGEEDGDAASPSGRKRNRGSGAAAAAAGGFGGAGVTLAPAAMQNSLSRLFEDLYASASARPAMDPSDEVLSQLFPHQREALAWMRCAGFDSASRLALLGAT